MTVRRRLDVVGAGISGLATAYFVAKAHPSAEVHVWERDDAPGGLAGSFATPHFRVEKFYHHLFTRDVALQDLITDLGLADSLVWRPAGTGAYYNSRPYRLSSPLDLLRFRPLPVLDRVRLGLMVLRARRERDWRRLDDESARDYIVRTAGERVYRVVWEPLFHGKFGRHADTVSAAWLWSKLVDRGGSRGRDGHEVLGYVRGGLGVVFDALVQRLRDGGHHVHLGEPVRRLIVGQGRVTALETGGGRVATDQVVSAVHTPQLADLLDGPCDEYRRALRRIEFLANVCLVLTLRRSLSEFYWTNVTDPSMPFVGIVEQTRWADAGDFDNRHVAYVSAYVTADDPRLGMPAEALLEHYVPHIQRMFPDFDTADVEACHVWRERFTQPIVSVGYRHLIPALQSPINNLFVCTMAQIYPSDRQVSNGVEMARQTADLVLARLREEAGRQ